ncbi:MAG: esterase [Comamonas sp.]|nr:esterase [Comamonas sp.]
MATTHLLYLHGFRSSPQSAKARMVADYVAQHHPKVQWLCPQLPPSPRQAMQEVLAQVANWPSAQMAVVGSSLGGYYASYIAQQKGCKSALLNPSTQPERSLAAYIGQHPQWHEPSQAIFFKPEYLDELRALDCSHLPPAGAELGIFATGDELLNWQDMAARYPQAQQHIVQGSDHALSDFAQHLPTLMAFLDLA